MLVLELRSNISIMQRLVNETIDECVYFILSLQEKMNKSSNLLDASDIFTPPLTTSQDEEKEVERQAAPSDSNSRDKGIHQSELFETQR